MNDVLVLDAISKTYGKGGPAPVRRFLPELIELIRSGEIQPGKVFTQRVPLEQAAEAYAAMDERREIKVLLEV